MNAVQQDGGAREIDTSAAPPDLFGLVSDTEISATPPEIVAKEPLDNAGDSDLLAPPPAVHVDARPSLGRCLRESRETRGFTIEEVAGRLHMRTRLVQALEADDYSHIEHAIYLKGYLASYARLVGLPADTIAPTLAENRPAPPPLVATGKISRSRYLYERYSVPAVYLLLTGLIVGPSVWLATHGGLEQNIARLTPLDTPAETTAVAIPPSVGSASGLAGESVAPADQATSSEVEDHVGTNVAVPGSKPIDKPLMASLAPFSMSTPGAAPAEPSSLPVVGIHRLEIKLSEASWVEIVANDGSKLEYGLLVAGTTRNYDSAKPLSVRLGNSSGAEVTIDGRPIDIAPYRRANVAHFRVSGADGAVSAIE